MHLLTLARVKLDDATADDSRPLVVVCELAGRLLQEATKTPAQEDMSSTYANCATPFPATLYSARPQPRVLRSALRDGVPTLLLSLSCRAPPACS